jgi:phage repressor protein C with HTH and peptisase S24 domain
MDLDSIPPTGRAVIALRKRSGLSVRAAADAGEFGSANGYRHYEIGYKEELLPITVARQLVKAFAGRGNPPISSEEIMQLAVGSDGIAPVPVEANARLADDAPEPPLKSSMARDLPVYGTTEGGPEGTFWLNMGEPIDRIRRPTGLLGSKKAFALYVEGDSMSPWKEPGQRVYINPDRPPSPGCYVVVEFMSDDPGHPPHAMIKRLIRRSASKIELQQYNPPLEFSIPTEKVVKVYRVLEDDDLWGI